MNTCEKNSTYLASNSSGAIEKIAIKSNLIKAKLMFKMVKYKLLLSKYDQL